MQATASGHRTIVRAPIRAVAVVLVTAGALLAASPTHAVPCWRPPVVAPVADPFRAPACRWCAGNRGIEYRVAPGTTIRAAATGEVTFAGTVAGVHYLVVRSADGRRQTYGRLDAVHHGRGDLVVAGAPIGTAGGDGFHFGVRLHDAYVDPAPLLGELVGRRRLVPTTADRPRPAPAELRCLTPTGRR